MNVQLELGETTVTETKKIEEIPLNGRFILDVALLSPGTSATISAVRGRSSLD